MATEWYVVRADADSAAYQMLWYGSSRKAARAFVDQDVAPDTVRRVVIDPQQVELHPLQGGEPYHLGAYDSMVATGYVAAHDVVPEPSRPKRRQVPRPKTKPRGPVTDPDCLPHEERLGRLAMMGSGDPAGLSTERLERAIRTAADNRDPQRPFSKDTGWVEVDGVRAHHDVLVRHLAVRRTA
jgi:hypothetical protein